jgi:hypothetical protein
MPLTTRDFDNAFLQGKAVFEEALADTMRQLFEPVALDALAQQVRQLPEPVRAEMKRRSPQAWQRLFGDTL